MFASGFFEDAMVNVFMGVVCLIWLIQSYAKHHPEVKDAAQKAASAKIISLIGKWLK